MNKYCKGGIRMKKSNLAKEKMQTQKFPRKVFAIFSIITVFIISFILIKLSSGGATTGTASADLKILKREVSDTVKYYPYKAGKTNMEVLAVKASDGMIKTAFNTCQICYDSGRGYYMQQGDVLICQNCGNRFQIDQIEVVKGGCNPVPITKENKIEDDSYIIISQAFMEENKDFFKNWRR